MKITYVHQRGAIDCGVAALAMACGVEYASVAGILSPAWSDKGINDLHLKEWWMENGWAWQEKTMNHPVNGHYVKHEPWPPRPFAPSHVFQVEVASGWHFSAMDELGEVFDPWDERRKTLDHPDYLRISTMFGLWKVGRHGSV